MGAVRKIMQSWPCRIGALVLSAILLYTTAHILLPRTADGISVTVLHCASIQFEQVDDCPGTTIFDRTFTDEATVSEVRTTLERMHYENLFDALKSNISNYWAQRYVYRIDLLWHGMLVKSYTAPEFHLWWDITTLGMGLQWATDGPTTWQDLKRLTGMPVEGL